MVDLRREGTEAALVRHDLAGETHGEQRPAVKPAGEGDHGGAFGMDPRNLDGILDRLGSGIEEQRFLRKVPRRRRIQPLGEADVGLVGSHVETGMGEQFRLLRHRRHHPRVPMTGVDHRDARGEIDEAPALHVPEFGVLRLGHVNALGGDAIRHGRGLAALQITGLAHRRLLRWCTDPPERYHCPGFGANRSKPARRRPNFTPPPRHSAAASPWMWCASAPAHRPGTPIA